MNPQSLHGVRDISPIIRILAGGLNHFGSVSGQRGSREVRSHFRTFSAASDPAKNSPPTIYIYILTVALEVYKIYFRSFAQVAVWSVTWMETSPKEYVGRKFNWKQQLWIGHSIVSPGPYR